MKKRTGKTKRAAPKKDWAWFAQNVAELKAELEKLPADRQTQVLRELKTDDESEKAEE